MDSRPLAATGGNRASLRRVLQHVMSLPRMFVALPTLRAWPLVLTVPLAAFILIGTGAAYLGLFRIWLVLSPLVVIPVGVWTYRILPVSQTRHTRGWLIAAMMAIAVANGMLHHETILGERDSGVYALSAAHLAETGHLQFVGPDYDPLSTYAGFFPTSSGFVPQFLPGYIIFLAAAYSVSDDAAFAVSVGLTTFLILLLLSELGLELTQRVAGAVFAPALWMTAYVSIWFTRQTLSENLQIPLLLSGAFCLVLYAKHRLWLAPCLGLILMLACSSTRLEGLLYLGTGAIAMAMINVRGLDPKKRFRILTWIPAAVIGILGVILGLLHTTHPEYLTNHWAKVVVRLALIVSGSGDTAIGGFAAFSARYIWDSLVAYGFLPLFAIILLGVFLGRWRIGCTVFAAMFFPSFALFFDGFISIQQPWFMRHYWALLFTPACVLSVVSVFGERPSDRSVYDDRGCRALRIVAPAVLALLISVSFATAAPLVLHSEDEGAIAFIATMASATEPGSIIMVPTEHITFAAPLKILHDRDAYVAGGRAEDALDAALGSQRPAYFLAKDLVSPNGGPSTQNYETRLELAWHGNFTTSRLRQDYSVLNYIWAENFTEGYAPIARATAELPPREVRVTSVDVYMYRIVPITD